MAQRRTVSGRRTAMAWLAIILVLVLAIALAAVVFIIGPQQQLRQQAHATSEARQAEVGRLYAAGLAFQNAGDWEAAEAEFKQLITLDPNYKDARTRLAEVRSKLSEVRATATAAAAAQAEQSRMDTQATATARTQATVEAQPNATATAETAPTATLQALEAHYQKGLAYINLEQWPEAKAELEQVFDTNPNYKEVQTQLAVVNSEIAKLTPTATPTSISEPELQISDLAVASGRDYQVEYNALQVGRLQYTDRDYVFTLIPPEYEGLTYIRTANDDKGSHGTRFLVFKTNRSVRVFVAYDSRIANAPAWLATWQPTGETLWTSNLSGGVAYDLFQKDFAAGWIELGGVLHASGNRSRSMYSVLILPK